MSAVVLMRLSGPMQSWGTRSRFIYRDTEREPTLSGVVGIVAAAMGRSRDADLADLAAMELSVRVDRAGHIETDYQTALDVIRADGSPGDTVQSWRHFLADASFLVALAGPEPLCREIQAALEAPRWPLYLGRKGYVPGEPIAVGGGVQLGDPLEVLSAFDWPQGEDGEPRTEVEAVVPCARGSESEGELRQDVPLSFTIGSRRYRGRYVIRTTLRPAASDTLEVSG